jgi:hypothetical protein
VKGKFPDPIATNNAATSRTVRLQAFRPLTAEIFTIDHSGSLNIRQTGGSRTSRHSGTRKASLATASKQVKCFALNLGTLAIRIFEFLLHPTVSQSGQMSNDEDTMRTNWGMRESFFERGLRGKRPGALVWRLNRSCYEGQLAGYLRYLDDNGLEACLGANGDTMNPIVVQDPIPTTRGDRTVAGAIAAGCIICSVYIASHLVSSLAVSEIVWDVHTVILCVIMGMMVGLFVLLGYACSRVVFAK